MDANCVDVNATYQDEHCVVDFQGHTVWVDGRPLALTRKEFELLALLARNAGQIVPRDVLLMQVWGYSARSGHGPWTSISGAYARSWGFTARLTLRRFSESATVFSPFSSTGRSRGLRSSR
jgi:hypothetical protein